MKKAPHIREYRGALTGTGLSKPRKLIRDPFLFKTKGIWP